MANDPYTPAGLAHLDKDRLIHPFTSIARHQATGPFIVESARGIRLRGADGREYIDGMAGLWCVNCGYGREEMATAIEAQVRRLSYYHSFLQTSTEPVIRVAERLGAIAPGNLNKIFFGNSGSDANDTNVKLVWYYNNLRGKMRKKKIIARKKAYHGVTIVASSLSGLPNLHASFDVPLDRFLHVSTPHHYWEAPAGMSERDYSATLATELDETIQREDPETVAAFIAEPVMGAGGVLVPPEGYFDAIVPVLKKHDVLFIDDEVICGFGRLGTPFGAQKFGFQPDMMTVAKGLTCGYVPMSASIISDDIWAVLREASPKAGPFAHGFTYSGHPVAAAAALCSLDLMEKDGWVANAESTGAYMQQRLRESFSGHPIVGEVRGMGLIAGIELVASKEARKPFPLDLGIAMRLHYLLKEEGLISRAMMNTMALSPPLIITPAEVDEVIARFARGLDKLTNELSREGAIQD